MQKIKKALKISFLDGIFASCMIGLTADYITPYALALKATNTAIGVLSALPNFASSLAQLISADLTEKLKSRKKVINLFVLLQAAAAIPIILVPYLFKSHPVRFLIICVTIFSALGAIAMPAWQSLMSDYIPYKSRGKYFGWRNKNLGVITVFCAFLAGGILHFFKQDILKGFLVIFCAAFFCRIISWIFLLWTYEPKFRVNAQARFSFFDFIKRIRSSNFARFVIFVSALNFCVNLAAPFFSVFMLKDLKFNYLIYTAIVAIVPIVHIFTINRWGNHADRVGNVKVLKVTSLIIACLPLWWVINHSPVFLIFVQLLSGFGWAGFSLCATNFVYDSVSSEKRTRCFAYFNVCNGISICLGALCGGFLANALPALFGFKLLSLFIFSSLLRLFVVYFFSTRIKEVRPIQHISSRNLFFSVAGLKPAFREE